MKVESDLLAAALPSIYDFFPTRVNGNCVQFTVTRIGDSVIFTTLCVTRVTFMTRVDQSGLPGMVQQFL